MICLFRNVFCRNLAKLIIFVQLLHYCYSVVNDSLHEPYLLLTSSSFILILSESHRGCLIFIWVKFVEIRSKNLMSSTRSLFSDKARYFSQSERALYGNFFIIYYNYAQARFLIMKEKAPSVLV